MPQPFDESPLQTKVISIVDAGLARRPGFEAFVHPEILARVLLDTFLDSGIHKSGIALRGISWKMFQRLADYDLEARAPGKKVGGAGKYRSGTQLGDPTQDGPGRRRDSKEGRKDRTTLTWILVRQIITTLSSADRLEHRPKIIFSFVQRSPKTLTGPEHASVENRITSTLINANARRVKGDKDASQFQT